MRIKASQLHLKPNHRQTFDPSILSVARLQDTFNEEAKKSQFEKQQQQRSELKARTGFSVQSQADSNKPLTQESDEDYCETKDYMVSLQDKETGRQHVNSKGSNFASDAGKLGLTPAET